MWGAFTRTENDKKVFPDSKAGHSVGCQMIGHEIVLMSSLDESLQDHVLSCSHDFHESVKFLFRFRCDETYTKEETIEEGKLF